MTRRLTHGGCQRRPAIPIGCLRNPNGNIPPEQDRACRDLGQAPMRGISQTSVRINAALPSRPAATVGSTRRRSAHFVRMALAYTTCWVTCGSAPKTAVTTITRTLPRTDPRGFPMVIVRRASCGAAHGSAPPRSYDLQAEPSIPPGSEKQTSAFASPDGLDTRGTSWAVAPQSATVRAGPGNVCFGWKPAISLAAMNSSMLDISLPGPVTRNFRFRSGIWGLRCAQRADSST